MLFKRRPSVPLRSPSALWLLTDGKCNSTMAPPTCAMVQDQRWRPRIRTPSMVDGTLLCRSSRILFSARCSTFWVGRL